MKQTYFMKAYKKRWTYRLMALGFLSIVVISLICMGIIKCINNTNNPTIIKTAEDYNTAIRNDSYIHISTNEVYDLGLVMKETRSKLGLKLSESTTAHFVAINLNSRILPVSLPNKEYEKLMKTGKGPNLFKGTLNKFEESDLKILKDSLIKDGIPSEHIDSLLYTTYLQYTTPIESATLYFVLSALLATLTMFLFISAARKNTLALKSLKKYSNGDLEIACKQIDNEIKSPNIYKNNPIIITENYIIVESQQIVFAMPIGELMWVYKKSTKNKIGKKSASIVFVFSDKGTYNVDLFKNSKNSDSIVEYISEHTNTAIVGYSEELANLLKKNPNEFIHQWKTPKDNLAAATTEI